MGEISDLEFRVKMCLSLFGCEVNILAKQNIVQCNDARGPEEAAAACILSTNASTEEARQCR